ncbi:DUF559 domain-containing protein [Gordonia sp. DT219]|uniref:DUF559 domain-containing protein n=1 Tax=Gordonia sp. DT219 TaxID=3416658 RepID=UPI003CEB9529
MNIGVSTVVEAAVRPGHVLRTDDVTGATLDELLDTISDDLPVFLDHRGPDDRTAAHVSTEVLDALEKILVDLFPAWLPGGRPGQLVDVADAESAARALCRDAGLAGPAVVIDLARSAAARTVPRRRQTPESRAAGLAGLLRHAYRRPQIILAVRASAGLSPAGQRTAAAAYEWLAVHARCTVWLSADALEQIIRVPRVRLGLAGSGLAGSGLAGSGPDDTEDHRGSPVPGADTPILAVSRPVGAPSPNSRAEQTLETVLSRRGWAADRQWNRRPGGLHPLAPVVVVDLLWATEQVIVEIDGPDHRRADKYANDRSRDNLLQQHGYLVLRYTNEQVLADADLVADELREILDARQRRACAPTPIRSEEAPTWTTRS